MSVPDETWWACRRAGWTDGPRSGEEKKVAGPKPFILFFPGLELPCRRDSSKESREPSDVRSFLQLPKGL